MLLFLIFTTVSGAVAVQWTSSSTFPNGSLVQACVGDNISLPWDFNMTSPQRIFIEWFKDAGKSVIPTNQNQPHPTINLCSNDSPCTNQEETILAYYYRGVFTPFSSLSPHIDFIPNAGIILPKATLSDAGYYRAEVSFRGDLQTYVQGAFVHVSEGPVTIDGGLHAYILPKRVYQETTGQWHLQIGCGTFLSLGRPSVSVKWNTPSREIINSTSYDNGVFILTVSNPVEDGEYSCFLERISPAVLCLHNQSSMNRLATVDVKGLHTRISLLEGGLEALREETVNLTVPVSDLEDFVPKLETSNKIFEEKMDILQDTIFNITTENKQLRQEVKRLESVDRNITTENKQLIQEVQRLESVGRNITDNNRNITGMIHDFINQIKDVKGDVRKLQSYKDDLVATLFAKDQFGLPRIQWKDFTEKPTSCKDVKYYDSSSGIHTLFPGDSRILNVYCDQSTDNGGWMVSHKEHMKWSEYVPHSSTDGGQLGLCAKLMRSFFTPFASPPALHLGTQCLYVRSHWVTPDQITSDEMIKVIQRRQDGSVNFYRDWNQYEMGFGNMSTEFWIGLANVYHLTKSKTVKLRVDLTDFDGSTAYAVYNTFNISGAETNYRLNVGGYKGTAGDSLASHNKMQFSTFDRDHDTYSRNCAQDQHGAWWYANCHYSNLNGRYKSDGAIGYDGVNWYHWKSYRSLKRVEMKIKE